MSAGPLRRTIGTLGLVALVPVVLLLGAGRITPEDAATRAVAIVLGVVLLGRGARMVLTTTLRRVERRSPDVEEPAAAERV